MPAAVAAIAVAAFAAPAASAATQHASHDCAGAGGAVFALTDNPAGNAVAAYYRAPGGALTPAGTYRTGGLGGVLSGSVVDHTASQGSLEGYRVAGSYLVPLPGSSRALNLGTTAAPAFTATPGQVALTPDGSQLLVTTKGATNSVDVFAVRPDGRLSASPTVNSLPGDVPFAVAFDQAGHVALAEAGRARSRRSRCPPAAR